MQDVKYFWPKKLFSGQNSLKEIMKNKLSYNADLNPAIKSSWYIIPIPPPTAGFMLDVAMRSLRMNDVI